MPESYVLALPYALLIPLCGDPGPCDPRGHVLAQLDLTCPGNFFRPHAELAGGGIDVPYAEVDQSVRVGIAFVLLQEQPHPAPGDFDERGKSRFEAVFHLRGKAEPLVSRDRSRSILDAENRDGFLGRSAIVADRSGRRAAASPLTFSLPATTRGRTCLLPRIRPAGS